MRVVLLRQTHPEAVDEGRRAGCASGRGRLGWVISTVGDRGRGVNWCTSLSVVHRIAGWLRACARHLLPLGSFAVDPRRLFWKEWASLYNSFF